MFFSKVFQLSGKQVLTFTVSAAIFALVGFSLVRWMPQKSIDIDELIKKANPETPFLETVFSSCNLNYDDYLLWNFFISSYTEFSRDHIDYYNTMMCRVKRMIKSSQQANDLVNFMNTEYKYNDNTIRKLRNDLIATQEKLPTTYKEIFSKYAKCLSEIKSIDETGTFLLNTKISDLGTKIIIIIKLIEFECWRIGSDELKKELHKMETNLNLVAKNLDKPDRRKMKIDSMPLKEFLGPFSYIMRLYSIVETGYYFQIFERDVWEYSSTKFNLFPHVSTLICNCLNVYEWRSKNATLKNE